MKARFVTRGGGAMMENAKATSAVDLVTTGSSSVSPREAELFNLRFQKVHGTARNYARLSSQARTRSGSARDAGPGNRRR